MGIYSHLTEWRGIPVKEWTSVNDEPLTSGVCYAIRTSWDEEEPWLDQFAAFLAHPGSDTVIGIVVGSWSPAGDNYEDPPGAVVEAIVGAREKLPHLTALFIGDILSEENEISWIGQTDLSPLFTAYPRLEHIGIRGSLGLSLGIPKLPELKSLTIECGGLPVSVIEEISAAELPALEHLELYLGTANYGGEVTIEDLQTILQQGPEKFPKLSYLGLRDYEHADALAIALAEGEGAPILKQISTLDLSLGTLSDEGVQALAVCPTIARLTKLDIHHHYAGEESVAALAALGITVDASDVQDETKYGRYVAVGE